MFDTTKDDLKAILRAADQGKLQLPDFQRDYVWDEEDVRSLIASIASGFPVGALLTLETGGSVNFKPRLLAGVPARNVEPPELLLDGQQRVTSLYQSLFAGEPVRTRTAKGKEVERYYYLDIRRSLEADANLDEAIVGVPRDRILRTDFGRTIVLDLSSREKEFEQFMFPLNMVFECHDWLFPWRDYWRERGEDIYTLDKGLYQKILEPMGEYKMPLIKLDKENSREAICLVFEKVNVGGKKLDAFELLTAIYAADNFNLREDWAGTAHKPGRRQRMIGLQIRRDVLSQVASTDFLQACTLLHTRALRLSRINEGFKDKDLPQVSCRRDALLGLPLAAYQVFADAVETGFIQAGSFLNERKIIWHKDIPYPPQMVALAAVFAILGNEAQNAAVKEKLALWFWCVTLGELYGSTTETRLARDVPEIVDWVKGNGPQPRSVDEALFQRERLHSLRTRLAAAYKGVHALLMEHGCRDFISGKPADVMTFFNDQVDIHHVFPQDWCKKHGIQPAVYNSVVNKTPLSKLSNITIGGDAPSVYLARIEQKHGISSSTLDEILRSHLIEPDLLRNDNFTAFFDARSHALASLVSSAMGKPVVEEAGANETELEPTAVAGGQEDEELELAS